jgi:hypothetical protein
MHEHILEDFDVKLVGPEAEVRRYREHVADLREEVKDLREAAVLEGFIFRRIENGKLAISPHDELEIVQHVTRRCSPRAKATKP